MTVSPILPDWILADPTTTTIDDVTLSANHHMCTIHLHTTPRTATCPQCHLPSPRVHSRYRRHLMDVPLATMHLSLILTARRFFCDHATCPQRIFTERLPSMVAPYARRTHRLIQQHTTLGFALGGRAAARLTEHLHVPFGRDGLLADIRAFPLPIPPDPTVVGVDDWALRKGTEYGTIVLDLITHQPLDLLMGRSMEPFATWLAAHPTVTHVSRDRATSYTEAVYAAAPDAIQIADRWHLLHNLGDALLTVIEQQYRTIQNAASPTIPTVPAPLADQGTPVIPQQWQPKPQHIQTGIAQRHAARAQMHATILHLHQTGWRQKEIATHLGVSPKTVRRYLAQPLGLLPQRRSRGSHLDPFIPYLVQRWEAGCINAAHLFREVQAHGFPGQASTVRAFIQALRKRDQHPSMNRPALPMSPSREVPARRTLVTWILRDPARLTRSQLDTLAWITEQSPRVARAMDLTRTFTTLLRTRCADGFDHWLDQMDHCDLPAFQRLSKSFRQDAAAIRAALTMRWSQGPVEGTIHRLKLLKRQMYGRAKLDLLRQRLLVRY